MDTPTPQNNPAGVTKDVRRYEKTAEPCIVRLVQDDGKGALFFAKEYLKKRYFRSLETNVLSDAKPRAKEFVELMVNKRWDELRGIKKRSGWATLPQVYEAYLLNSTIKTRKNVVWAMRYVLRAAGKDAEGSVTQLDAHLVWLFQQAMKRKAVKTGKTDGATTAAGEAVDPVKLTRAMRSANSLVRQARQLFAEDILPAYNGLEFPPHVLDRARDQNHRGFMTALLLDAPVVQYVAPQSTVIKRLGSEYHELRAIDPGAYVVFLLGAFVGLRNNEVAAARWDWIEADGEDKNKMWLRIRISSDYTTKTSRPRDVEIPAAVFAELVAMRGAETFDKVPGDRIYVVPAPHFTDRNDRVFRRLNKWLRARGLDKETFSKGFYELRKYFGDMKAWESGSTYQAARALGNSPEVAEKFYSSSQGKAPVKIAMPAANARTIRKAVRDLSKEAAA